MKSNLLKIVIALLTSSIGLAYAPRLAVINCPVADLIGKPAHNPTMYKKIPLYADNNRCLRIHQALFNEVVKIIDETPCEYCVEISNAYFVTEKDKKPHTRYWTLKKNCTLLDDDLKKYIPNPISYKKENSHNRATLILTKPWHDARTGNSYSVGTRFIYCPQQSDNDVKTVILYDFVKEKEVMTGIHRSDCRIENDALSHAQARADMICLIRTWIGMHYQPVIPYVWGGCSYIHRYTGSFKEKHARQDAYTFYAYPRSRHDIQTGFDCAGLIIRAAQCAGLPFFCKNSYTAATVLKETHRYEDIQVGDILWIPGHVMLIADLESNTIIEARGYPHGYGKLQEIAIAKEFEGIETIKQLTEHMHTKKALKRLDKKGTVIATIPRYKILKLC